MRILTSKVCTELLCSVMKQSLTPLKKLRKGRRSFQVAEKSLFLYAVDSEVIMLYLLPPITFFFNDRDNLLRLKVAQKHSTSMSVIRYEAYANDSTFHVSQYTEQTVFILNARLLAVPLNVNTKLIWHNLYKVNKRA